MTDFVYHISLSDLPLEVTDYVIRFLSPKDLCNFSLVDKLIYSMTTTERKLYTFTGKLNSTEKRKNNIRYLIEFIGLWGEWLAKRWNIDENKPFRPHLLINYKRKKDLYGVLDKISSPVIDFARRTYQGNIFIRSSSFESSINY